MGSVQLSVPVVSSPRRLIRRARAGDHWRAGCRHWPNTEILLRADSHYCGPEVLDWCRANGLDYILGIAPTATLRRHVEGLEASTKARFEAAPRDGKLRRFMEFFEARKTGAGSSGSSPGSKWAPKDRTPASSSPI